MNKGQGQASLRKNIKSIKERKVAVREASECKGIGGIGHLGRIGRKERVTGSHVPRQWLLLLLSAGCCLLFVVAREARPEVLVNVSVTVSCRVRDMMSVVVVGTRSRLVVHEQSKPRQTEMPLTDDSTPPRSQRCECVDSLVQFKSDS